MRPVCSFSCDLRPWRKSAWSSAIAIRRGVFMITSGRPYGDREVRPDGVPAVDLQPSAELVHARGDRPRRPGAVAEAEPVVVDADVELATPAARVDRRGAGEGVAPDVARALEHDLEDVLDEH